MPSLPASFILVPFSTLGSLLSAQLQGSPHSKGRQTSQGSECTAASQSQTNPGPGWCMREKGNHMVEEKSNCSGNSKSLH